MVTSAEEPERLELSASMGGVMELQCQVSIESSVTPKYLGVILEDLMRTGV